MATDPFPSGAGASGRPTARSQARRRAALLCPGIGMGCWDLDTQEVWPDESIAGSFNLRELLAETAAMLAPDACRKKLALTCDLDLTFNCGLADG